MGCVQHIHLVLRSSLVFLAFLALSSVPAASGTIGLSAGYRVDDLDWNIAGNVSGANPDVLSELTWSDLDIFQVGVDGTLVRPGDTGRDPVFLGHFSYGWITDGRNRDSDFAGDNRTLEWSRSDNDAGNGHVLELEGGVGLRFRLRDGQWTLLPQFGYAYYEQDLVMRDGFQTISDQAIIDALYAPNPAPLLPPVGPIIGLDSSYYAWWYGPWLGLQAEWRMNERFRFDSRVRWHKVEFRAEADWNLRTDLEHPVSFEHRADGDGFSLRMGAAYRVDEQWGMAVHVDAIDLKAVDGYDLVYLSGGGVASTRLNEVNWESWSLAFSLQRSF